MSFAISGSSLEYLANLDLNSQQLTQTQTQITSGLRVQQASDDPTAIAEILQLQANIAQNTQVQTNLSNAKAEVSSADSALQTSISILQNAQSIAAEGATSTATAESRANLAEEVKGLQAELISASQTQVNGKYIFSGDMDTQASYQADSTQSEGVAQLITPTATRTITDASGTKISVALTAQEIFDPRNSDNTAATGNAFAAINDLLTGLQNNDQTAITNATTELKNAGDYVNQKLAAYGEAENRIQDATDVAQKFQTQNQQELSTLRDTDQTEAALALSQEKVQQEAAVSAESSILQMKNIFDYLA